MVTQREIKIDDETKEFLFATIKCLINDYKMKSSYYETDEYWNYGAIEALESIYDVIKHH